LDGEERGKSGKEEKLPLTLHSITRHQRRKKEKKKLGEYSLTLCNNSIFEKERRGKGKIEKGGKRRRFVCSLLSLSKGFYFNEARGGKKKGWGLGGRNIDTSISGGREKTKGGGKGESAWFIDMLLLQ